MSGSTLLQALDLALSLLQAIPQQRFAKALARSDEGLKTAMVDTLYSESPPPIGSLGLQATSDTLPVIVNACFAVNRQAMTSHEEEPGVLLRSLEMISSLIDSEAVAMSTVDGPAWVSFTIEVIARVRVFQGIRLTKDSVIRCRGCPCDHGAQG